MERRDAFVNGTEARREADRGFRAVDIMSWLMSGVLILFILLAFFCLCAAYSWFLHRGDAAQGVEQGIAEAADAAEVADSDENA